VAKQRQQTTVPRSRKEIAASAKKEALKLRKKMDDNSWSIRVVAKELEMHPSRVRRILKHL